MRLESIPPVTIPESSCPPDLSLLISDRAERALRDRGLWMRAIPFFEHFDAFRYREAAWAVAFRKRLIHLPEVAALRTVRSYAFADELTRDVLRNFCPALPQGGEAAQRALWGAAVLLDEILDETALEPEQLTPLRTWTWFSQQTTSAKDLASRYPAPISGMVNTLLALLDNFFEDCYRRSGPISQFSTFHSDLLSLLDAELQSPFLTLDQAPDGQIRSLIHQKSAGLCWVGFQSCLLGIALEPSTLQTYRQLCDAVGEILWIMDDLIDIEEDLAQGVWNRTLWGVRDRIGAAQFNTACRSSSQLAHVIATEGIVEQAIHEVAQRIAYLESHPTVEYPDRLLSTLLFWILSWLGIYTH